MANPIKFIKDTVKNNISVWKWLRDPENVEALGLFEDLNLLDFFRLVANLHVKQGRECSRLLKQLAVANMEENGKAMFVQKLKEWQVEFDRKTDVMDNILNSTLKFLHDPNTTHEVKRKVFETHASEGGFGYIKRSQTVGAYALAGIQLNEIAQELSPYLGVGDETRLDDPSFKSPLTTGEYPKESANPYLAYLNGRR